MNPNVRKAKRTTTYHVELEDGALSKFTLKHKHKIISGRERVNVSDIFAFDSE